MSAVAKLERWQVVHEALLDVACRRSALDAEEMRWLHEAEGLQIWKQLGLVSMVDYLERALDYAPRTAQERMRVARALADLPELMDALATNELAFSAIKELARVSTRATEQAWRAAARGKNLREIEQLVSGRRPGDLPTDAPDDDARLHTLRFDDISARLPSPEPTPSSRSPPRAGSAALPRPRSTTLAPTWAPRHRSRSCSVGVRPERAKSAARLIVQIVTDPGAKSGVRTSAWGSFDWLRFRS
jgi:hypothetical protein